MPWILKKAHTFNNYVGEEGLVKNHSEAKKFKSKKSANDYSKKLDYEVELLKITENKN